VVLNMKLARQSALACAAMKRLTGCDCELIGRAVP
jgi:hypothetical protein